jgi:hypothetical protein
MIWSGNECGKNKVMRISRHDRPKTTGECGIF